MSSSPARDPTRTTCVISLLAKKRFNVPRVIARVNDPASEELFDQSWGVDALVSPATSLVSMIRPES